MLDRACCRIRFVRRAGRSGRTGRAGRVRCGAPGADQGARGARPDRLFGQSLPVPRGDSGRRPLRLFRRADADGRKPVARRTDCRDRLPVRLPGGAQTAAAGAARLHLDAPGLFGCHGNLSLGSADLERDLPEHPLVQGFGRVELLLRGSDPAERGVADPAGQHVRGDQDRET